MYEHYFTKINRKTIQAVRLEYGKLGEKYVLKTFEGEENPNGLFLHNSIFPREEIFDGKLRMLKKVLETRKKLIEERWILKTNKQ